MADIKTENRVLLGVDTITPLVETNYAYSYSSGVTPLTNNQVRIICNTFSAGANIYLPPISSFNGNYNINILIFWEGRSKVNVYASIDSSDRINYYEVGSFVSLGYSVSNFTIGYEGIWVASDMAQLSPPLGDIIEIPIKAK